MCPDWKETVAGGVTLLCSCSCPGLTWPQVTTVFLSPGGLPLMESVLCLQQGHAFLHLPHSTLTPVPECGPYRPHFTGEETQAQRPSPTLQRQSHVIFFRLLSFPASGKPTFPPLMLSAREARLRRPFQSDCCLKAPPIWRSGLAPKNIPPPRPKLA